ncbi:hypothetical protein C2E23DRAFT_860142 [Lenzites betulinus]|nr:hypothetical protein C2E23DRAFT_860142 [Lenzites betulinus]
MQSEDPANKNPLSVTTAKRVKLLEDRRAASESKPNRAKEVGAEGRRMSAAAIRGIGQGVALEGMLRHQTELEEVYGLKRQRGQTKLEMALRAVTPSTSEGAETSPPARLDDTPTPTPRGQRGEGQARTKEEAGTRRAEGENAQEKAPLAAAAEDEDADRAEKPETKSRKRQRTMSTAEDDVAPETADGAGEQGTTEGLAASERTASASAGQEAKATNQPATTPATTDRAPPHQGESRKARKEAGEGARAMTEAIIRAMGQLAEELNAPVKEIGDEIRTMPKPAEVAFLAKLAESVREAYDARAAAIWAKQQADWSGSAGAMAVGGTANTMGGLKTTSTANGGTGGPTTGMAKTQRAAPPNNERSGGAPGKEIGDAATSRDTPHPEDMWRESATLRAHANRGLEASIHAHGRTDDPAAEDARMDIDQAGSYAPTLYDDEAMGESFGPNARNDRGDESRMGDGARERAAPDGSVREYILEQPARKPAAMPDYDAPTTWFMYDVPAMERAVLLHQGVWAPKKGPKLMFYSGESAKPSYLLAFTGITHVNPTHIAATVKAEFLQDPIWSSIVDLVKSNPEYRDLAIGTPEDAARHLIESMEVRTRPLMEKGRAVALVTHIYMESPTLSDNKWVGWRAGLRKHATLAGGKTITRVRPMHRCEGCHSADHMTDECPFPHLAGWTMDEPVGGQDVIGPQASGSGQQRTEQAQTDHQPQHYPPPLGMTRGRGRPTRRTFAYANTPRQAGASLWANEYPPPMAGRGRATARGGPFFHQDMRGMGRGGRGAWRGA